MSGRERRRRREAPMPVASAGLVRFFQDEVKGIKIRPEIVIFSAILLVVLVVTARFLL